MPLPLKARPAGLPIGSQLGTSWITCFRPRRASARPTRSVVKTNAESGEAATILYKATGVPLLDEMMALPHVEAAAKHSLKLVGLAALGVAVGMLVLHLIEQKAGQRQGQGQEEKEFNAATALASAVIGPAKKLLPFYGIAYSSTVLLALSQVAATKLNAQFKSMTFGLGGEMLKGLEVITQLVQDLSELVLIVMATWAAIEFKNRILGWWEKSLHSDTGSTSSILRPVSGVLNALILLAAAATTLSSFGINIGPLMASVGGIGVVVGIISQSIMGNVAAAILLYSSRPFMVGDRIQLQTGADIVVEGLVVDIEPVRTIIRDDDGNTVFINNSEVATFIVKNMGRGKGSKSLESVDGAALAS